MESTPGDRAVDWLAAAAPDPQACRADWERSGRGVMLLPAGRLWDVLLVPGRLGHLAFEVLARRGAGTGPVYADFADGQLGFLVPLGTAGRWVGTGVRSAGSGSWVALPHPAGAHAGGAGRGLRWLAAPDGSGRLTDPAVLELALHEVASRLM
ncbi:hypothetical protein F4556_002192 [Kitasatospora gansuensis]|uniref:DNA primase/polymerase bifunctional N-terminal domain-containing protein n=1 Tax=Kitasatospora gansuensis TaxID=258050 RepID=A0A7W7SAT8_9ACTN|nr:hypothetical protein [Kitasatospora gansuensis]MBB4946657.1 hypothetical protein [Kitasatospora gansuensis]